jgi:predicted chitinase
MEKGYNDFKTHIVKKEDTVQSICSQHGITETDLVQANPQIPLAEFGGGLFSPKTYRLDIKEGDTLKIPFYNEDMAKSGVKTIKGKNLVKVGEWENYEVEEWFAGTPETDRNPANVKWELYYLQNDTNPQKILEKNEGHFRFQEKATDNKYKIVAFLNEPDPDGAGSMIVNVEASEKAEILSVKLSDVNNNPISQPLAYGEIINAHVETTGLKGQFIYVSLWEDDATGDGHSSENEKNLVDDGKVEVGEKGVAHKQFVLKPDFKKIANAHLAKGDSNEGSKHEYYVTAFASGETKASANVNVRNPDFQRERKTETEDHLADKKQPPKPAVPPFKKNVPVQQPKTAAAAPQGKAGISSVTFSDVNGRPISGTVKQSALRVNIKSTGLKGKEIRFKLYEEDVTENELLLVKNFTITGDDFAINLSLDKIPKSSGDDFFEGSTQELFVDIEVIESKAHIKSTVIDVDTKAFKHEPAESTTVAKVADVKSEVKGKDCGEKFCIKKGSPKSELIREINIRLAGFGGNVPTDEFTDRTEKMVKQFQKDYMKVPETGKVCGNVLMAIDDFSLKFDISATSWSELKCSCSTKGKQATSKLRDLKELNSCAGFGDGTGKDTYGGNAKSEKFHRYEYPGIHRSLLFGIKALQFYFSKQTTYKIDQITSGYRCRFKNYTTTNHQGKAIDIQFSKGTWAIRGEQKKNLEPLRDIRDNIYIKYLGAQKEWPAKNLYSIEPIDLLYDKKGNVRFDHTFSWIHFDVREFDTVYLDDKYFCKNATGLNGKPIMQLAKEAGFEKTCQCIKTMETVAPAKKETKAGCYCKDEFTEEILQKVAPSASKANVTKYLDGFNKTFTKYGIDSCLKKIHFLAQVIHESGSFLYNVEQGNADYLAKYDGWHGRGLIQLTLKENYEAFEKAIGEDFTSSTTNRDKVKDSPYAVYSAGWFWNNRSLNDLSSENDFIYITYKVNGGFNHLDDRLKNVKKGFDVLYTDCKNDKDKKTEYEFTKSKGYGDKKCSFAWGLWHDPLFTKIGCEKSKEKAIEGYQRYIDLTDANDKTTNYYGIHKLSHFEDLVKSVVKNGKTIKEVNVREAALQRVKELKK